jgi:hypothetical protein
MSYYWLLNLLGLILFSFIFWKKLKEDYLASQVFSTEVYMVIGVLLGYYLSSYFFYSWWFWSSLSFGLLAMAIGILRFRLRFYETLESTVIGLFPWTSFIFLADSIKNSSWFSLAYFILIWILILIYVFLNKRYKNFVWYKSGRVGFSGLFVLAVMFITRGIIAILFPFMLSFVGGIEPILSAAAAFVAFLLIYNLSRYS